MTKAASPAAIFAVDAAEQEGRFNMAKLIPWHLQEFFGASTVEESLDAVSPVVYKSPASIPVLDDPQELRKGSGHAADSLIASIDRDELISQLCPIDEGMGIKDAQIDRDVERFSPTPKAAPGLEKITARLERIMAEALPTSRILEEWTPAAHAMVANLIQSARPSRKKIINDRLDKRLYRPAIMDRWNEMLVAFDNDVTVALADDALFTKAQRFLGVSA
jgi:hypothetical protein